LIIILNAFFKCILEISFIPMATWEVGSYQDFTKKFTHNRENVIGPLPG